ncbi:MAG: ABC transporter permease, partial [Kordiimonadaceae bacterium]|nr:ABC transporter permease [Kordiimonadaceae bacterium]
MFQNYLLITVRNITRNKLYSFINFGGLAIGFAACLLIYLFVKDELSYDRWIPGVETLYSVETTVAPPGRGIREFATTPGLLAPALIERIPEVIASTRLYRNDGTFTYGDKMFQERIREVDANFFDLFDIPMLKGSREQGLANNSSILINEDIANKYFGDDDPMGKILTMDKERDYTVAGVFKNLPHNTHFGLEMIVLLDATRYNGRTWETLSLDSVPVFTYVKLRNGANPEQVNSALPDFIDQNFLAENVPENMTRSEIIQLNLMPVSKIHLYATKPGQMEAGGDIVAVYTFSAVATLILIIASINFINLATARSIKRAREVSMRKVLGATRKQIIVQFIGESVFFTLIGLLIAIVLVEFTLPSFNSFLQKDLVLNLTETLQQTASIIGLALIIGIGGGLYPAFFLSSFRPAKILRSNKSSYDGGGVVRQF